MTKTQLLDYLASDDNIYGLDPVAAHGFLCATVVGKPLPNWLSVFFEGHEKDIDPQILTALQNWQNELIDTLKNEDPLELPFDDDHEVDLSDEGDIVAWSIGFVDAMYGNEDSNWFDESDTEEEVADLTLPMIVLSGIADDDEDLLAMRQDDEMMITLVNSLQDNLTELYLLFHTQE